MRPPRDRRFARRDHMPDLQRGPGDDHIHGADGDHLDEDEHPHMRAGADHQIGAHHAGDRARRPDQRRLRMRGEDAIEQGAEHAAQEIEGDETSMPQRVLDIVAENPQEQHVADDVRPAAMQEHVGEERQETFDETEVVRAEHQARRHAPMALEHDVLALRDGQPPDEDRNVERDQRIGDIGRLAPRMRGVVGEWNENHGPRALLQARYYPGSSRRKNAVYSPAARIWSRMIVRSVSIERNCAPSSKCQKVQPLHAGRP